jgi:hypothetical protein
LHPVGRQLFSVYRSVGSQPDPDFMQSGANCIWLVAMQYKIPKFINSWHAASDQTNEICI